MKILSNGGGVQTFAIQCLIAQGEIEKPDLIIFSDTGGESEETYQHIETIQKPLCQSLGIPFVVVQRDGANLFYRSMNNGVTPKPPYCSWMFKRDVINAYIRKEILRPATGPDCKESVEVMIGISLDEEHRGYKQSAVTWVKNIYPLLELELTRDDCLEAIARQGLPIPPKSGCWYCPYKRENQFFLLKEQEPIKFSRLLVMEQFTGHNLRKSNKPLISVESQDRLFPVGDEFECSTGYCGV